MECRVLGPLEVTRGGRPVSLGGTKQRALLGLLVAARGQVLPVDRLVDELWGDEPPPKVLTSVQAYVANLRRALEPDRPARAPARLLVTRLPGYALHLPGEVDAAAAERLATAGAELVPADPARARDLLDEAARLWRGEAYADVSAATPTLAAEAARLTELRLAITEHRWRAELALGADAGLVGEMEILLTAHPLRESAWGLLALALYRAQRQGDALTALRRARQRLADELGVDPGPELRRLEQAVLAHDPALRTSVLPSPPPVPRSSPAPEAARTEVLVGRDEQLARATGCLVRAAAGRGQIVVVSGDAGIGKTAFARALIRTAAAMRLRCGWGTCAEAGGAPALWPWTQALGGLLAGVDRATLRTFLGAALSALAPVLPDLDPLDPSAATAVDADSAAFRLAAAVAALVRRLPGAALLVLDDVQWADADSLHLLRRLAPSIAELPVLLVVTLRDPEAEPSPALADTLAELARVVPVRVRLGGLGADHVADYVREQHAVAVPPAVAAVLRERTGGNPFYLGELARLLAEEDRLADPAAAASADVPDGVRDVVRRRLARLPEEAAPLLAAAAICGPEFDLDLVHAAVGLDDADVEMAATDALLLSALVVEAAPGRFRFSHALVRDAIRAQLTPGRRRELHGRLAAAMEELGIGDGPRLAELAHHHSEAGPASARSAWTAALRAAERAAAQPAPAEAVRLLLIARSAVAGDPTATPGDRHRIVLALARALRRAGRDREAWSVASEAAQRALAGEDVVSAAELAVAVTVDAIWSWRGYLVVDHAAVVLYERLLRRLPAGRDVLRGQLLAALAAELYYDAAAGERGIALSTEAVRLTRAAGGVDDLAHVLELRHVALERPHLLAERLEAAEELVELGERAADAVALARALVFRGRDRLESGAVSAGLRDYDRARELAEAHAIVPVRVVLTWAAAMVLVAQGRFADAEQAIAAAEALHASTTLAGGSDVPIVLMASLHLARGTLPDLEPMLGGVAAATGFPLFRDWHALALLSAGQPERAVGVAPWAEQPAVAPDYMGLTHLAVRARLWSALAPPPAVAGLRAAAGPYAERLAVGGTGISVAGFVGHGLGLLARAAGDVDAAVDAFTAALQRSEEAGFAAFAVAAATELARTLRERGGPGDGPAALHLAAQVRRGAVTLGISSPDLG